MTEKPELSNFISKDGVKINVELDSAQLTLLAIGGFSVLFFAVLLANLVSKLFFRKDA